MSGGKAVLLTGPFGDPERTIGLDRPMTVAEVIAEHDLRFRLPTIALMDGEPVMRGEWAVRLVGATDVIAFVAVPGGGGGNSSGKQVVGLIASIALAIAAPMAGAALAGAMGLTGTALAVGSSIFSAALLAGGSLLLNALFPPPSQASSERETVYLASAATNQAKPLDPLVCLYGTLRYAPPFASRPYSEFAGNDHYLYQLFLVTLGKASISKIEIGETEAWNSVSGYSSSFSDLTFQVVQPGQDVTLFPANVVTSTDVAGQQVPDPPDELGPYVLNAAGTEIDRIAVDFAFPGGLWKAKDRSVIRNSIRLRAQYRRIDDAGAPLGGWTNLFAQNISAATRTPQRMTRSAQVAPGRYEVKFLADEAFDSDNSQQVNKCVWTGLRGYLTGFLTPPGCTLLAMKVRANEQLSQLSASQIRVTATRHLPTWTGAGWSAEVATRSIAWAAADLLRNTDYSIGLTEAQYDIAALASLEATWAGRGDTFNAVFDRTWSVADALRAILRAGRAQPVRIGGRIGFVRLEPKAIKRATFTPRNVIRGSFQHRLVMFDEEKPDSVIGSYIDQVTWQPREVTAAIASIGSEQPQKIEWFGITDHDQCWRESVTEAAVNAYQREFVSFTADWEGKLLVRGDPILVTHPFVEGVETAALRAREGGVLTLDRDPSLAIAGDAYVILRDKDGREWGPCLVASIDGREFTLDADDLETVSAQMGELDLVLPGGRSEPAHVVICDGETRPFNGLLVSATPNEGGQVDVVAVIDAPEVYMADGVEVRPSPWTPPTLPPAVPLRPVVLGLYAELRPGVAGLELDAMWLPAPGATSYVAQVSYDNEDTWTPVYADSANRFSVPVLPQLLVLRVAAVGSVQGPWAIRQFVAGELPDIRILGRYLDLEFEEIAADISKRFDWAMATVRGAIESFKALGTTIEEVDRENLNQRAALSRSIEQRMDGLRASFDEVVEVAVGPGGAITQKLESLYAALGGNSSQVNVRLVAVAAPDGVSSRFEIQLRLEGDTFASTGFCMDLMPDGKSLIVLDATRTAITTDGGTNVSAMFDATGAITRNLRTGRVEGPPGNFWDLTTGAFRTSGGTP